MLLVKEPFAPPGNLDPAAFRGVDTFLLRRVGDRGEWVLGGGEVTGRSKEGLLEADEGGPRIGHLAYGCPGMVDALPAFQALQDGFAESAWWEPAWMIHLSSEGARFHGEQEAQDQAQALYTETTASKGFDGSIPAAQWTCHTSRERYLDQVRSLQQHIKRGDIYEVNYCVRRTASIPGFDPFAAFAQLLKATDAPFAAFYRQGPLFALCMSPERYLRIEGQRLITQPMKGTRKRGASSEQDEALAYELANDPKERSENIMAVDVARNDLSRVAAPSSVAVDELCAVKTYPNVHHMVSTVSAQQHPGVTFSDVIRATFPMASMTGAPKRRAMELIDGAEDQGRGLFSGSLGFRLPDGTVDMNVVIRTITFDASTGRASLLTGSAITALSDPEKEWEECELKARSVLNALGHVG